MKNVQNQEKRENKKKHYTNKKFFTKLKITKTERDIFAFCVITFEPIKIRLEVLHRIRCGDTSRPDLPDNTNN